MRFGYQFKTLNEYRPQPYISRLALILLIISVVIFAASLAPALISSSKLKISIIPLIGALITVILGISSVGTVLTVIEVVWNPTLTLVAIIIFSLVMDEAGFFRFVAISLARHSKGNTVRLFLILCGLTGLIAAFFTNDGAVLIMTPIVLSFLKEIKADRSTYVAFLISVGFISDSGSIPLLISNLVNILTAGYFGTNFQSYAFQLVIPGIFSTLFSILVLFLFYRKALRSDFSGSLLGKPSDAVRDRLLVSLAVPSTAALIISYAIVSAYDLPIALIALPVSMLFLGIAVKRGLVTVAGVVEKSPWHIVVLSAGLYVILFGMADQGLSSGLLGLLRMGSNNSTLQSVLFSGLVFTALSASMNNLPSVMLGNLALKSSKNLAYLIPVNIIANDIGPKITPIGSLATLLWFHRISQDGKSARISYVTYSKAGIVITIPVLIATLLVYWLTMLIL